jgi:hypothetical protein
LNDSSPDIPNRSFVSLALTRQVVVMALKVSFVVGTILALINHGDNILEMSLSSKNVLQILLTYLVPYCVSTWSAVRALKD